MISLIKLSIVIIFLNNSKIRNLKFRLSFSIYFLFTTFIFGQSTASPQVSIFEIAAPQLDTIKKIWIYLPKEYANSNKKYPVIYMHDGQNLFDRESSYAGEWRIDESLDSIKDAASIVVGIGHGGKKRIEELTPFQNERYGGGGGNKYLAFIRESLKPHIDSVYRTKPEPENTTIFGSSLGGLISFYAAIKYPETFGKAGIYSPAFWINEDIYDWITLQDLTGHSKLIFLSGTKESEGMVGDMEKMIKLLQNKGLEKENYNVLIIEGGRHNEELWSKNFPSSFIWLND